jgi:hypothetical protein
MKTTCGKLPSWEKLGEMRAVNEHGLDGFVSRGFFLVDVDAIVNFNYPNVFQSVPWDEYTLLHELLYLLAFSLLGYFFF